MQTNDPDKQLEPTAQTAETPASPPNPCEEETAALAQVEEIVHQMSHPTTAILALSQLMVRNENLDGDTAEDIQTIAEQALLLKKLMRELQVTIGNKNYPRPV